MPEGHGAVTHYVAPENVENYTTVLELSMAVALEDLVEFTTSHITASKKSRAC